MLVASKIVTIDLVDVLSSNICRYGLSTIAEKLLLKVLTTRLKIDTKLTGLKIFRKLNVTKKRRVFNFILISAGAKVIVAGWGRTDYFNKSRPEFLQALKTKIIDWDECKKAWPIYLQPHHICAGLSVENKSICVVSF